MLLQNKITDITRISIADEMLQNNILYCGRLTEPDFLARVFNLRFLPSKDRRYNNAYDDIYQHVVNNSDWDNDWLYYDSRINLLNCEDSKYTKFLAETLHPRVRTDDREIQKLIEIYNNHLSKDGFEVVKTEEISGRDIFSVRQIVIGQAVLDTNRMEIKRRLDTEYVTRKIATMNEAIHNHTDLAIGMAKELIETTCKSILKQKTIEIDPTWNLARLLKETTRVLDFSPKEVTNPQHAEKSINQILSGITSIVHGVGELRNSYGTGHGKDAEFKPLEPKYAKLLVGVVTEIVLFYLSINGETAELVEENSNKLT